MLWPVLEVDSEELVKGGVAVLQAAWPRRKHLTQILTYKVLKWLNVLRLLYGLISREVISSQRISQHMSQVKIIPKQLSVISFLISALQIFQNLSENWHSSSLMLNFAFGSLFGLVDCECVQHRQVLVDCTFAGGPRESVIAPKTGCFHAQLLSFRAVCFIQ